MGVPLLSGGQLLKGTVTVNQKLGPSLEHVAAEKIVPKATHAQAVLGGFQTDQEEDLLHDVQHVPHEQLLHDVEALRVIVVGLSPTAAAAAAAAIAVKIKWVESVHPVNIQA